MVGEETLRPESNRLPVRGVVGILPIDAAGIEPTCAEATLYGGRRL